MAGVDESTATGRARVRGGASHWSPTFVSPMSACPTILLIILPVAWSVTQWAAVRTMSSSISVPVHVPPHSRECAFCDFWSERATSGIGRCPKRGGAGSPPAMPQPASSMPFAAASSQRRSFSSSSGLGELSICTTFCVFADSSAGSTQSASPGTGSWVGVAEGCVAWWVVGYGEKATTHGRSAISAKIRISVTIAP